jgi:hypothetical protein
MIDTKKIRKSLEGILAEPIDIRTNEYLKSVINYAPDTKFASINVLIDNLPQDVDGIYCKHVLEMLIDYLSQPNVDHTLLTIINKANIDISIEQLLNTSTDIDVSSEQKVETVYSNSKFKIAGLDLTGYLEYDVDTKTVIEHIYRAGADTTSEFD